MFNTEQIEQTAMFFGILTLELAALFLIVSFLVAVLNDYFPAAAIQRALAGRGGRGHLIGAGFGALTPFCSCSTIPVTVGLLSAGAPFGATMSFLIASPILNPFIVALLIAMFGWQLALVYSLACFALAVIAGMTFERLGLADAVKPARLRNPLPDSEVSNLWGRLKRAAMAAVAIFLASLPYLILGAAIGSLLYGFVPEAWLSRVAGPDNPFAVPLAAAVGVPLYLRAETLIPIGLGLQAGGMSIGAVIAVIVAGSGASIPEVSLLSSIFRPKLVVAFVVTVFTVAIVAGYSANALLT